MKKLKFNSTLDHKQSDYKTREIIVEKVITLYGKSFSELKDHPLRDDPYIAQNRDLMYIDSDDVAHCLLMVDYDSGDGVLVESEGSNYARKSQFIPNSRALIESNELTVSERKLHTADATKSVTFKNRLKKFTAEIVKKDSETGTAQGDGTLSGAVYGIFNGEELVDTYTTDENGYFRTKEYICGDNWTLREISVPEGYLLDETVCIIGADPKNYIIEKNTLFKEVSEKVIKGEISIIKHSDDGTTQIETPETGAEFEVYLKNAGSYGNAKENERDYLITDENGFAETKLMPYGIYIVHQTKGWENTEFMPDFEVNVSENEKNYFYLINDAVLTSFVRIVKKDAETGNVIPVSGIGFKVWDCADSCYVTQKINYPSEMILDTFYTDDSGTLMLPQELSYVTLALAISNAALTKKFCSPHISESDNLRYSARVWLINLGLNGEEYKNCRKHLISHLEGNIAWLHPEDAIKQRGRLKAERIAAREQRVEPVREVREEVGIVSTQEEQAENEQEFEEQEEEFVMSM